MERTLYSEAFEHDACGIGAIVSIDGIATASAYCCRSATAFSPRWALLWEKKETTA